MLWALSSAEASLCLRGVRERVKIKRSAGREIGRTNREREAFPSFSCPPLSFPFFKLFLFLVKQKQVNKSKKGDVLMSS